MAKAVFKRYDIKLHGKKYVVMAPSVVLDEIWLRPYAPFYKHDAGNYLWGNRKSLRWLRDAFILLSREPNVIVYFDMGKAKPLPEDERTKFYFMWKEAPDLLFYNFQTQLKRSEWRALRNCLKYSSSEQYVLKYQISQIKEQSERILRHWEEHHSYYDWKRHGKSYYEYETLFVESRKERFLETAVQIQEGLETDLDKELEDRGYLQYLAGILSYYETVTIEYVTYRFYCKRYEEEWK